MDNILELTEEQQNEVRKLYAETPDLTVITKKLFNREDLDGRSKEGRAIRKFLVDKGLKYSTTQIKTKDDIILNEHQKNFIAQNCGEMTSFRIAQMLFPEKNITTHLAKECRSITDYIREYHPDKLQDSESAAGLVYSPPATISEAVGAINLATAQELDYRKLSAQHKQSVTAFIRFINSPRVIQIINTYGDEEDRKLFASEFTRYTWDKPDLTADDITLYIGVCQDIVTNKRLVSHIEKLNRMFEETEGNGDLSIRLSETMQTKSEEYDKVQKRIASDLKKLNGDRSQRIKMLGERSSNFLALVEAFQSEEERKRMLILAQSRREEIKEEVGRLESLSEFKARILGMPKGLAY